MIVSFETTVNPGEKARFLAEMRIEKSKDVYHPKGKAWWALWLGWWLLTSDRWRRWLWTWEVHDAKGMWFTWSVMVLGFEVTWQWRRKS
jgi:hypothetical protein